MKFLVLRRPKARRKPFLCFLWLSDGRTSYNVMYCRGRRRRIAEEEGVLQREKRKLDEASGERKGRRGM